MSIVGHPSAGCNSALRSALAHYLDLAQLRHVERCRLQSVHRRRRLLSPPTPADLVLENEELDAFEVLHAIPTESARNDLIAEVLADNGLDPRSDPARHVASFVDGRILVVGVGERSQVVELFIVAADEIGVAGLIGPAGSPDQSAHALCVGDQAVS